MHPFFAHALWEGGSRRCLRLIIDDQLAKTPKRDPIIKRFSVNAVSDGPDLIEKRMRKVDEVMKVCSK